MATRIGLAQQNGESEVNADTICDSAAISACKKSHGWQLALGLLSRMAKAKWKASEKDVVQVAVVQFESGKLETMVKGLAALVSAWMLP